jgi:hypothetical protein
MGVKGNRGGAKGRSGRKSKAEELGLAALLDKCFNQKAREDCILTLAQDCASEDFHTRQESRKLLLAYTFGKPKEQVSHVGEDGGAIEIIVNHVKRTPEED